MKSVRIVVVRGRGLGIGGTLKEETDKETVRGMIEIVKIITKIVGCLIKEGVVVLGMVKDTVSTVIMMVMEGRIRGGNKSLQKRRPYVSKRRYMLSILDASKHSSSLFVMLVIDFCKSQ
jgi:hypothetical protein